MSHRTFLAIETDNQPNMSVVVRTAQDVAGNVGAKIEYTTNRLLPPKQRERALENFRVFSNRNPKLAASHGQPRMHHPLLTVSVISCRSECPSWFTYSPVSGLRRCNPRCLAHHLRAPRRHCRPCVHPLHNRLRSPVRRPDRCHWQLHRQHSLPMGTGRIPGVATNQWR